MSVMIKKNHHLLTGIFTRVRQSVEILFLAHNRFQVRKNFTVYNSSRGIGFGNQRSIFLRNQCRMILSESLFDKKKKVLYFNQIKGKISRALLSEICQLFQFQFNSHFSTQNTGQVAFLD